MGYIIKIMYLSNLILFYLTEIEKLRCNSLKDDIIFPRKDCVKMEIVHKEHEKTPLQQILEEQRSFDFGIFVGELKDRFETFYSSDFVKSFYEKINKSDTLFTYDAMVALSHLVAEKEHNKSIMNCVNVSRSGFLSKNGRIKVKRDMDTFEGIRVSCSSPEDIESVTLFAEVHLDKNRPIPSVKDFHTYVMEYPPSWYAERPQSFIQYFIPLKTIKSPKTNFIRFYEYPIITCADAVMYGLSIGVQFKKQNPALDAQRTVEVVGSILDHELRWFALEHINNTVDNTFVPFRIIK